MQRERVQDQYPWTWELPLVVICAVLLLGVTVCQLGRSLANWFAGAGWWWPTFDKWVISVPGVLAGDGAAGLPGAHPVASAEAVWGWLVVVGLLTVLACTVAGVRGWQQWGPGRMRGMASITEAHELLGKDRLWKVRHVVRPDLYPPSWRAQR